MTMIMTNDDDPENDGGDDGDDDRDVNVEARVEPHGHREPTMVCS